MAGYELTEEQHRQLRHLPMVVEHITAKANEMLAMVNDMCLSELKSKKWQTRPKTGHFGVQVSDSPDNTRPRAYVHPVDGHGIRIEMTHHVLLKAAAMMGGK
jgi:hypothetical protein